MLSAKRILDQISKTLRGTLNVNIVSDNSGGGGGATDVNILSPTGATAGSKAPGSAASEALVATATECKSVLIQADPANADGDNVLVGNSTAVPIVLGAGDSIQIDIDDANKIHVQASTANGQTLNYIILT